MKKNHASQRLQNSAYALIIGGALGNVIDRFVHEKVVDFLLFYWNDHYYPAFNVADSFICVGAVLLVLDGLFHKKQPKPTDEPTTDNP